MNRRNFFKMAGAAVASAICAPLVKLFPAKKAAAELQPGDVISFTSVNLINESREWMNYERRFLAEARKDLRFVAGDAWE